MTREYFDALAVARMFKHIKLDSPDITDVIGPLAFSALIKDRLDFLIS